MIYAQKSEPISASIGTVKTVINSYRTVMLIRHANSKNQQANKNTGSKKEKGDGGRHGQLWATGWIGPFGTMRGMLSSSPGMDDRGFCGLETIFLRPITKF
ncbi:unnamed protein product [Leptosia nina]|uniref:Uncharacterized protein n=1 Tax=Leptosia nina TaxID=320188 RepID=A0AAV1IXX7_9NEOP